MRNTSDKDNIIVTVFTPVYNRSQLIKNLYKSLCEQSCKKFEWLIVDDGSIDNIEDVVKSFNASFNIRFLKQINKGKHVAINAGIQNALGELFFIVDSDDSLTVNAIEKLLLEYDKIKFNEKYAGVSGLRIFSNGDRIGGELNFKYLDVSPIDFRYKYNIKGDVAEAFKVKILKKYLFPEYDNEKFCPESLIWNRIGEKYLLRYFCEKIYICEYLEGGLTANIVKIRMKSPNSSMLYYSELFKYDIPLLYKLKAAINYWRFSFCKPVDIIHNYKLHFDAKQLYLFIFLPISVLFHILDIFNTK